jgi:hypothetical protein
MEEAVVKLVNQLRHFDNFHKVPWIWGSRRVLLRKPDHSFLRQYKGFGIMLFLNCAYCTCVCTVLLRNLLSAEKDPDMSIEGTFFLLVVGFISILCACCAYIMVLHSTLMGLTFIGFSLTKGTKL